MRSGRTPLLLMGLVWLLVVAVVGSVTYLVVDQAGKEIGKTAATRPVVAGPSVRASTTARPRPASPRPTPTRTKTPKPTPTPSATAAAPTSPTSPTTPSSAPSASTREPAPTTTPTPTPSRSTTTRTFSTRGGTVVASCTGSTLKLGSITPRDGWRIEKEFDDGRLEVHFKSAEDEVEVKIRCVGGVPTQGGD